MANVATVNIRIISNENSTSQVSDSALVRALLGEEVNSYWVPLVVSFRDGCRDIQVGFRWTPVGKVENILPLLEQGNDRVFVRWHNGGTEFDEIYELDEYGHQASRMCRYCFDEIAVQYKEKPMDAPSVDSNGFSVYKILGTYLGQNSRFADVHPKATMTTPAGSSLCPADYFEPADTATLISSLTNRDNTNPLIKTIEWRYKNRVVRIENRFSNSPPRQFGLDDWDNCVDSAYLLARGQSPVVPESVGQKDRQLIELYRF